MSGANKTRKAAHKDGTAAAVMGRVGKDDELAEAMRRREAARQAAARLRAERLAAFRGQAPDGAA